MQFVRRISNRVFSTFRPLRLARERWLILNSFRTALSVDLNQTVALPREP
jgi:hypothetical protein